MVEKERELFHELREQRRCLNTEEPEIVDTKNAKVEYQLEKRTQDALDTKEITQKLKHVRKALAKEQSKLSLLLRKRTEQESRISHARKVLKRNTGWRGLLLGKADPRPQFDLESDIATEESLLTNMVDECNAVRSNIEALLSERKYLYNSYPKVAERHNRQFRRMWGPKHKGPRISE